MKLVCVSVGAGDAIESIGHGQDRINVAAVVAAEARSQVAGG